MAKALVLKEITKRFPLVLANDRISLDLEWGEVLALVGENGAGKSTLMKIVYGLQPPDAGEMWVDGKPYRPQSPLDAIRAGIGMVHQHFMLVEPFTVLENLVLGQLERELSRALGLDRFQVEVPAIQGGSLEETRFSVGKYLTPELFLGYQVDLRGEQTFAAEYRADGITFTLSSSFGQGVLSRLAFGLGYDLTDALSLTLTLETGDDTRFSVGAAYRW